MFRAHERSNASKTRDEHLRKVEREKERGEKKEQPKTRERTGREIIAEEALFVISAK